MNNHHRYLPDGRAVCGADPDQEPAKLITMEELAGGDGRICSGCWLEWLRLLIEMNGGVAPEAERLADFIDEDGDTVWLRPERLSAT